MRRGQAIVETLIAILLIMAIFEGAYRLTRMVVSQTLLDHAAARAARSRAVGFNEFMCRKTARAAMIPVAGRRIWPTGDDIDEVARVPVYLASEDESLANGTLDYEYWPSTRLDLDLGGGLFPSVNAAMSLATPDFSLTGRGGCEAHFPYYMFDGGR